MNKKNTLARIGFFLTTALFPGLAMAYVSAMPSFYDFGSVPAGRSSTTTIQFMNQSSTAIPFFNVSCSGDFSAFRCLSFCSYLPAYGSCSVQVEFTPRNGDGQQRMVWVNGSGGGNHSSSTVYGTDARSIRK